MRRLRKATLFEVDGVGGIFKKRRKHVFKKRTTLMENYIPDKLPFREREIEWIANNLYPAIDGDTPPHMLIVGETGTGKTAVVMRVLTELKSIASDVVVGYTVANGTPYKVLIDLVHNMGLAVPQKGLGFNNVLSRFREFLDGRVAVIVLDEIDKMLIHSSDLLYYLSRWPNTCVIGISNKFTVRSLIDDARVLSSFVTRNLVFKRYDALQLQGILNYRAEMAFYYDALSEDVIPFCAAMATQRGADVRYALDLLLYAGDLAEEKAEPRVTVDHVRRAMQVLDDEFVREGVRGLSEVHKCLLLAVLSRGECSPSTTYEVCNRYLIERVGKRLSTRALLKYLKELELYGFVKVVRKGRGRGRGFEWKVSLSEDVSPELVKSALDEEFKD